MKSEQDIIRRLKQIEVFRREYTKRISTDVITDEDIQENMELTLWVDALEWVLDCPVSWV